MYTQKALCQTARLYRLLGCQYSSGINRGGREVSRRNWQIRLRNADQPTLRVRAEFCVVHCGHQKK